MSGNCFVPRPSRRRLHNGPFSESDWAGVVSNCIMGVFDGLSQCKWIAYLVLTNFREY